MPYISKINPKISVIISTYKEPRWLNFCLESYKNQTLKDFEIIIADDGSDEETKTVVDQYRPLVTEHVWHEDKGFRKTKILNKAIVVSKGDYLLFTDGDCIANSNLIETHYLKRRANSYLSGSYYKLDAQTSEKIDRKLIKDLFNRETLKQLGHRPTYKSIKFLAPLPVRTFLDKITTTKPTWNGHCSSGWKKNIEAVNGFNEQMVYGGEDRELGERLIHNGVSPIQIRHQSCLIHLHHKQGYISEEGKQFNQKIRTNVRERKLKWTEFGIIKSNKYD
jgi:glycosyltransferase involved in cell wall biosynthesis